MAKIDSNTRAHLEWMGFVQPHGLVVSAPALTHAGAILNRNDVEGQALLRDCVSESHRDGEPQVGDFRKFARSVLGWDSRQSSTAACFGHPRLQMGWFSLCRNTGRLCFPITRSGTELHQGTESPNGNS